MYCERNILHRLETSENIVIPENITIFLRYLLCMILAIFGLSWTCEQLQFINLVVYQHV